jgi:predicted Rossmann fold nucleotide-binding protein DprA/Smf involved in DNA uptake
MKGKPSSANSSLDSFFSPKPKDAPVKNEINRVVQAEKKELPKDFDLIIYHKSSRDPDSLITLRNRKILLLLRNKPMMIQDIAKELNLPSSTIYTELQFLRVNGYVFEHGDS